MKRLSGIASVFAAALFVAACDDSSSPVPGARVLLIVRAAPDVDPELDIATRAELAKGNSVLEAAAAELGLAERWGVDTAAAAAAQLAPAVTTARLEGTSLIELRVRRPDAKESAEIANAIAKAYVRSAEEAEIERSEARMEKLQRQIDEQQEKLEQSRVKMLELMEKHAIVDLSDAAPFRADAIGKTHADAGAAIERLRAMIGALESLSGEQLLKATIDLQLEEPSLTTRYPEYQQLVLARESLENSGIGSKHPKLVAIDHQIEALREMLVNASESARAALQSQLALTEQALANSQQENAERAEEERSQSLRYVERKRDYERERERLEKLKIESHTGAPPRPDAGSPVDIVEPAVPSKP